MISGSLRDSFATCAVQCVEKETRVEVRGRCDHRGVVQKLRSAATRTSLSQKLMDDALHATLIASVSLHRLQLSETNLTTRPRHSRTGGAWQWSLAWLRSLVLRC